jgi:hypothetical protein
MASVIVPVQTQQHRAPRKRAFTGLVGRAAPEDFPKTIPTPPLPEFDPEKDYADTLARFQEYAFDPTLRGADPKAAYEKNWRFMKSLRKPGAPSSKAGDPYDSNQAVILANTPGHHVITVCQEPGMRTRIPWWIQSEKAFEEFLLHLINVDVPEEQYKLLKGRELHDAAGLDFCILYEFYIGSREDVEIFDNHVKEFKREVGRQRITSSASAVTKRRQRLVERGNTIFGKESRPLEGPEYREHRAIWAPIRLSPSIKSRMNENC